MVNLTPLVELDSVDGTVRIRSFDRAGMMMSETSLGTNCFLDLLDRLYQEVFPSPVTQAPVVQVSASEADPDGSDAPRAT